MYLDAILVTLTVVSFLILISPAIIILLSFYLVFIKNTYARFFKRQVIVDENKKAAAFALKIKETEEEIKEINHEAMVSDKDPTHFVGPKILLSVKQYLLLSEFKNKSPEFKNKVNAELLILEL